MKKKKKKKFNFIKFLAFILIFYLIIYGVYSLFRVKTKNIIITGNTYLSDRVIIERAGLRDYPPLFLTSNRKIKNSLKDLELISDVKIKKTIKYELFLEIDEKKIILYYDDKYYLDDGSTIEGNFMGIPTLINYVPSDTLNKFLSSMKDIDYDIIKSISEIMYSPSKDEDGNITDEDIFILYMNDGNTVFISIDKMDILKKYHKIYASLGDKKGILHLDKGNYLEVFK